MTDFSKFAELVHQRFNELSKHELFVVGEDNRVLEGVYLGAFPAGTNPIYLTNTEHDCSCCKNFIRNIGNVVAIIDGKLETVWDVKADYPYNVVAEELDHAVRIMPITNLFRPTEKSYGAQQTTQRLKDGSITWNHFHGKVAKRHSVGNPMAVAGAYRTNVTTLKRGLEELSAEAVDQVLELITSNALYRGEEHKASVLAFKEVQSKYRVCRDRELFLWANAADMAAYFRNSVIGTLVQDLSSGIDIETAVKSFETKVAPTNYKRPTALITQGMIKQAMDTIQELDLEPALERRFAKISDVSVNNVLWVDNSVKGKMKGGLEDLLMGDVKQTFDPARVECISIDDFMKLLPSASAVSLLVEGKHQGNLMSLTAPVHEGVNNLFKWNNDFAWSYNGNVTDSIKERVRKAGGSVTGDLCCRLAWNYKDDLDFHMYEPDGGHIYFPNRRRSSGNGGVLDLDANGADGLRDDPAENIVYASRRTMSEGAYTLWVNNYSRRSDGSGFEVEVEFDGSIHRFCHPGVVRTGESVKVANIYYSKSEGFSIESLGVPSTSASKEVWGISTETLVPVDTVMYSPNYWDDNAVGNKHWFFVLKGCKNPEPARGIYNEFLSSKLEKHRKVFEILGSKTKCQPTDDQLSGVGFSSTNHDSVTAQVTTDKGTRVYTINF